MSVATMEEEQSESQPSLVSRNCHANFKPIKEASLDCSFSPLHTPQTSSYASLTPSLCGANWRQVAPICWAQVTVTLVVKSAARLHAAGYSSKWWGGGWCACVGG